MIVSLELGDRTLRLWANFRALRLYRERTGKGLGSLALAFAAGSEEGGPAALLDDPSAISAVVWALANGERSADVEYEWVEENLDFSNFGQVIEAVASAIGATKLERKEGEESADVSNPQPAAETSTSEAFGLSADAA